MRTILRTQGADGKIHLFSFETSPLLSQEEQIQAIVKQESLEDFKVIDWQYFDAHELKPLKKLTVKNHKQDDNIHRIKVNAFQRQKINEN